ncbi:MAG: hypothetical protein ACXVB6_15810 [Mucilaginibacter sp.]
MDNVIKIIIADDHLLFIDGLVSLLNGETDITIEDIANDGKELLELLETREWLQSDPNWKIHAN